MFSGGNSVRLHWAPAIIPYISAMNRAIGLLLGIACCWPMVLLAQSTQLPAPGAGANVLAILPLLIGGNIALMIICLLLSLGLGERGYIIYFIFMVLSLVPIVLGPFVAADSGLAFFVQNISVPISRVFLIVFWLQFFKRVFQRWEKGIAVGWFFISGMIKIILLTDPNLIVQPALIWIVFYGLIVVDACVLLLFLCLAIARKAKYAWLAVAGVLPVTAFSIYRFLQEFQGVAPTVASNRIEHLIVMNSLYGLTGFCILIVVFFRYRDERQERQLAQMENQKLLASENMRLEIQVAVRTREILEQSNKVARQAEALEKINAALTDSITYAQRLQQNLLPEIQQLQQVAPKASVLYEPRDIVSGDFYWCGTRDNWNYLAVGDGTGHGVPGAFMSILGLTLLNEALRQGDTPPTPLRMIDHVQRHLALMMRQDGRSAPDGFDLALLTWQALAPQCQFVGAGRPLLVQQADGWTEIPMTGPTLGPLHPAEQQVQTIDLHQVRRLGLYTDGYVDQFGGLPRRKLMRKQLLAQLNQHATATPQELVTGLQRHLADWQGTHARLDDVTVVIWEPAI